jgi:hypothetical protein
MHRHHHGNNGSFPPVANIQTLANSYAMKWLLTCAAVLLSGCSPTPHHFQVNIEGADSQVATASVSLCGKPEKALQRSGVSFAGTVASNCEGSGYVRLRFVDGTSIDCPISYVIIGGSVGLLWCAVGPARTH